MLDPPDARALPETLDAIERADLITVGPGSLYTSLITNLLVQGMPVALEQARGLRVYVCNLMTQANESLGLTRRRPYPENLRPYRRTHFRLRAGQHRAVFSRHAGALRGRKRRAHRSPTSSASRPWASAASPATSPVKAMSCATMRTRVTGALLELGRSAIEPR